MGLEDFERELEAGKQSREPRDRSERKDKHDSRPHRSSHHHHHRSHRTRDSKDEERQRRHKRQRDHDISGGGERRRHRKRQRSESPRPSDSRDQADVKVFDSPAEDEDEDEDEWVEKEAVTAPPEEDLLDQRDSNLPEGKAQRDAWMQEPSSLDIEIVASRKPKPAPSQFVGAREDHSFKVHDQHVADLARDFESDEEDHSSSKGMVDLEPAQHQVSYTFGDSGSSWRMTKLKAVYRAASEGGKSVEEVALERYGSLRDFDDAREEEREMDRRRLYGSEYVGNEMPSGELFQERKMKEDIRRPSEPDQGSTEFDLIGKGQRLAQPDTTAPPARTAPLDATSLNKLKAQLMKARLRKASNLTQLEEEYRLAEQASLASTTQPDVVVLNDAENRMLASGRGGEVTAVSGKRGRERGLVVENEDMSIEDMMRQEKRTKGGAGNEGRTFAERIAKDAKFVDDLDYMDDNAQNLSKKVVKSDTNLRNMAIGDFQKMQRVLEHCPLCHHEDKAGNEASPMAPVVSLATRTYLTLPTEPETAKGGAVIVPVQHRMNLLECDDDEWEEMRNFMKCLTRFYDSQGKGVLFYENAAHMHSKRGHAALNAIPLPNHLADTAPAYFKEAILSTAEQWSQHKPIIDTLALSQQVGYGKAAFRKSMVKEMPYFHVFFTLDGGMGHVVEDERKWPKGDLFAREIVGGMLDRGPEIVKKQGRWERHDRRVEGFRKKWSAWDWTKALMDAQ